MTSAELKDYLKLVIDLRKSYYETAQIRSNLDSQKNKAIETIKQISRAGGVSGDIATEWVKTFGIAIGCGVAGLLVGVILTLINNLDTDLLLLICPIIGIIIAVILGVDKTKGIIVAKKNNNALKEKAIIEKALTENALKQIDEALEDTSETMVEVCENDVIHYNYRNDLAALTAFYEYIDMGRCSELTGVNGAYNLYESEKRMDKIITQLDTVISNLEDIKRNQYFLYCTVQNMITQIETVSNRIESEIKNNADALNAAAENTAVSAYTAEIIKNNLYYSRTYENSYMKTINL